MSADLQITAFEKVGESSSKGQYIILGGAAPPQKISELRKKTLMLKQLAPQITNDHREAKQFMRFQTSFFIL